MPFFFHLRRSSFSFYAQYFLQIILESRKVFATIEQYSILELCSRQCNVEYMIGTIWYFLFILYLINVYDNCYNKTNVWRSCSTTFLQVIYQQCN